MPEVTIRCPMPCVIKRAGVARLLLTFRDGAEVERFTQAMRLLVLSEPHLTPEPDEAERMREALRILRAGVQQFNTATPLASPWLTVDEFLRRLLEPAQQSPTTKEKSP